MWNHTPSSTEHRAHRCLCAACGSASAFPLGVTAPVQYGPRITAWVSYTLRKSASPSS